MFPWRNTEQKMQNIHKAVKVVNNQVITDLPPGFSDREVEVILRLPTHQR